MNGLNLRRITSLAILFIAVIITYTGVVLYFAPPGRVANWSDWHFLGLNREETIAQHTLFSYLFVALGILHTLYNWKPLVGYLKNKSRGAARVNGNLVAALVLTALVAVGTQWGWTPFGEVMTLGEYLKGTWEQSLGSAPYAHAERDTLAQFSQKTGVSLAQSTEALEAAGIEAREDEALEDLAERYQTTPQRLFTLMAPQPGGTPSATGSSPAQIPAVAAEVDEVALERVFGSSLGKRTVVELAPKANLSTEQALALLAVQGVRAESAQTLKAIAEGAGLSAPKVAAMLLPR